MNRIIVHPVIEAQRYVQNAKTTLAENANYDPETDCYGDPKYVKAAGHYLWSAVLVILDSVFELKTKQRPHPDIKDYLNAIADRDQKLLTMVHAAYQTTHIAMGYDGILRKAICQDGIRLTNDIIDRCSRMLPKVA